MNNLGLALDSYLALRRALGFKLDRAEYLLRKFVKYMQQQQSSILTTALALDWATQSNNAAPITHAKHLNAVRGFARHLHASDPRHEVPPVNLIPYHTFRRQPYIYSDKDCYSSARSGSGYSPSVDGQHLYHSVWPACCYRDAPRRSPRARHRRRRRQRRRALHSRLQVPKVPTTTASFHHPGCAPRVR